MRTLTALSCSLLLLSACEGDRKRWAYDPTLPDGSIYPAVSVYLAPTDPPGKPKVTDLSDKGQAALITELGRLSKTPDAFKANYTKFFSKPSGTNVDNTVMDRMLVISISKGIYRPANRIAEAAITIVPKDFSFAGYSLVATQYGSYDLDKVDVKNDYSGSAELNPTLSGSVKGPLDIKAAIDHSAEHTYTVAEVAPKPTVEILPCRLILREWSQPNQDLSGTSLVKITLIANSLTSSAPPNADATDCRKGRGNTTFRLVATETHLAKDGKLLSPDQASLEVGLVESNRNSLHAKVSMNYVLRHVLSGGSTVIEDDDTVSILTGTVTAGENVELVDGALGRQALWGLCEGPSGLVAHLPNGQSGQLLFDSLSNATEMLSWLSATKARSVGTTRLSLVRSNPEGYPSLSLCAPM
jgi:hypothetical protein